MLTTYTSPRPSSWHIRRSVHRPPPHPLNRWSSFHSVGCSTSAWDCWSPRSCWISSTGDRSHSKRWRQDPRSGAIPRWAVRFHGNQCYISVRWSLVPGHNRSQPEHRLDWGWIRTLASKLDNIEHGNVLWYIFRSSNYLRSIPRQRIRNP